MSTFENPDAEMGPEHSIIPHKKVDVKIIAGEKNSPVFNIKGNRGIGMNFPLMPAVVKFSVYVSAKEIPLGDAGSTMALLKDQDFVPSATIRTAFSSAFVAEHLFCQIIADAVEAADYVYELTAS